ncbi:MAG: TonB-dependent receptor [Bacteroidales bacterium]|nr:TonB-dependent receptor [Bacteroidales bacterium]
MKGAKWLTDLKLRASWGTNGNQAIANGAAYSLFDTGTSTSPYIVWGIWNYGTSYDIAGNRTGTIASGYRRTQTGNPGLKWETSTQWDLGFDYNLWNYKLYGTFDWFSKNTYDILIKPSVISTQGEGADRYENGASMTNKGIEFTIGTRGKSSFGLTYDINANISTYRNVVTYLPESVLASYPGNGTTHTVIGRNLQSYYGFVENGLYKTESELNDGINVGALNKGKGLGRIKWVDQNGDGEITLDDRVFLGSPEPAFSFGLNVNLGFKNWDFSMFWDGKIGYYAFTPDKSQRTLFVTDMGSNKGADILKAWDPVLNPNSSIPALTTANNNNETATSTYFYENHSYGKLRNLTLGYTLPEKASRCIGLNRIRIYVTGQNLCWFKSKDYTGWDPEMTSLSYPLAKTFLGGLQISF